MVIEFLMMNPFHHRFKGSDSLDIGGEYNGYVAFDKELPLSWQGGTPFEDNNCLDNLVNVHGGITFDHNLKDVLDSGTMSIIPLTAIPEPDVFKDLRCIGWDCLHDGDTRGKWPLEAVKEETLELMRQIETL